MRQRVLPAVVVALLICGSGAGDALAQAPVSVPCGTVLTEDTSLAGDIVCGPDDELLLGPDGLGYAVVIGADGITFNLNGHEVGDAHAGIGVFGRDGVTIMFGRTSRLALKDTNFVELFGVAVGTPIGGVRLSNADYTRIERITAEVHGSALSLDDDSDYNVVRNSGMFSDGGVTIRDSDYNEILDNTICPGVEAGISIGHGSENTVVRHNQVMPVAPRDHCALESGIDVAEATSGTQLIDNTVDRFTNADGILVRSAATTLTGNIATNNGDFGIEAVPGVTAANNFAAGNGNPLQCLNVVCLAWPPPASPPGLSPPGTVGGPAAGLPQTTPPDPSDGASPVAVSATVAARQRLGMVLRRGLRVSVGCSERCSIDARLMMSARGARRYGLGRRSARAVLVGRVSKALGAPGSTTLRVKLTRRARSRLARARQLRLSVRVVAVGQDDDRSSLTRRLVLRR